MNCDDLLGTLFKNLTMSEERKLFHKHFFDNNDYKEEDMIEVECWNT